VWQKSYVSVTLLQSVNSPNLKMSALNSLEFSLASVSPAAAKAEVERCVWYGFEILGVNCLLSKTLLTTLYRVVRKVANDMLEIDIKL